MEGIVKYFFVFAHPEPEHSFQRALLDAGVSALQDAGHEVVVSNLYEMGFNPVASANDFQERRFPDRLQYDREQKHSVQNDALASDIKEELEKVLWCDALIAQFPLYWFSMPAIMKGWFDRVFVNSVIYGAGKRYETGGLAGRKALVCTSTGAYAPMFAPNGLLGDLEAALWHIHNGIFHYTGMSVAPPFVAWSPVHSDQETCDRYMADYARKLLTIDQEQPKFYHPTTDFSDRFTLRDDVKPATIAHRKIEP